MVDRGPVVVTCVAPINIATIKYCKYIESVKINRVTLYCCAGGPVKAGMRDPARPKRNRLAFFFLCNHCFPLYNGVLPFMNAPNILLDQNLPSLPHLPADICELVSN